MPEQSRSLWNPVGDEGRGSGRSAQREADICMRFQGGEMPVTGAWCAQQRSSCGRNTSA